MAKRQLKIAIDYDDVLVPTAHAIVDEYYRRYGFRVALRNFYSDEPEDWGVSRIEIAEQRVNEFLLSDKFARSTPLEEAVTVVHRLVQYHTLYVVTARADNLIPATKSVVEEFFPDCFAGLEFTNYYYGKTGKRRSKGEVCSELGVDVMVDDNPDHIYSAVGRVPAGILFGDYPWSCGATLPAGVVRCVSWPEVEAEIDRLAHS